MNKLLIKFAIAALFGAPLAGLLLPIAAQAAVGGPVCNVPADYATIQMAVTDAGCSTINVAAGTYAEQVAVNRSVVINGANAGIAGNGVRGAESIVNGTDTSTPFVITANNVTINGFTVENGSNGGFFSGIWSQTGTQNSSIMDNVITQNGFGVWAQCGGNCQITGNLFDGNNKPGPGSSGISADSTTGLTISNNEFKNHTAGNPILFQATGAGAHTNLTVSNNSFHDNAFTNVYSIGLDGAAFTGNTVTPAADATGFSFSGADSNVTVTMNTVMNGARGVRVEDAGFGLGANTGITVNRNDVSNNSEYGIGNITPATALVDGTCNWWGAANGPGPVGLGSGSPVTTNVSFVSWLTSSDLTSACNGSSVVLTSVTVTPATSTIAVMENDNAKKDDNGGDKDKHGVTAMSCAPTMPMKGNDKNKKDDGGNASSTVQLIAMPLDQNGVAFVGATTTFMSSNPAVATVDSMTGLVTAVSPGTATITVTSVSGNITVTATSVITVLKGDNNNKDDGDKCMSNNSGNNNPVVDNSKDNKKGKH